MMMTLFGLFVVVHGLIHLVYLGQSTRLFELRPGMEWPDDSWVFSKLKGVEFTRFLAGLLIIMATAGFVAAGGGVLVAGLGVGPCRMVGGVFDRCLHHVLGWYTKKGE